MKAFLKICLQYYLKTVTKLTLFVHRPIIVAVAGSINKPFVKNQIKERLESEGRSVRTDPKNFNTEVGLPLAVLNLPSGYNNYRNWLPVIRQAPFKIFEKDFPKYLVLGLGSSDPGDIKYLMSVIKPRIAVVTDITQRYREGFSDMDQMVQEYTQLAKKLKKQDLMVLNFDNSRVRNLARHTKANIVTFGFSQKADWRAREVTKTKRGQNVTIACQNSTSEYQIRGFGKHNVYALLIALIISDYAQKKEK